MATETELKLRFLSPQDAAKFLEHPLLAKADAGEIEQLTGTYYDTPDRELLQAGVGLRVRREHGRLIQTVKSAGTGSSSLHKRKEWEVEIEEGKLPDFNRLPQDLREENFSDTELLQRIGPCFTTDFQRTKWKLPLKELQLAEAGYVEVCLDQGEVRNEQGTVPIHEVELELKGNDDSGTLYEIALALQRTLPLVIENASKAQRGYELANPTTTLKTAEVPQIEWVVTTDDIELPSHYAFRALMENCYARIETNATAVSQSNDPEDVHQMYLGIRWMRSCLALFKVRIPEFNLSTPLIPINSEIRTELGWIGGIVRHARGWDEFAKTLDTIIEETETADILKPLRPEIDRIREEHHQTLRKALSSVRYSRLLLGIGAWLRWENWYDPLDSAAKEFLNYGITSSASVILQLQHDRMQKAAEGVYYLPPREQLQRIRIEAEKLTDGADFFQNLYSKKPERSYLYMNSLSIFQDKLDIINDEMAFRTLQDQIGLGPDTSARHFLQGWYKGRAMHGLKTVGSALGDFSLRKKFWK